MARTEIQRWGNERLRVRAWRGDPSTAYIAPIPGRQPVSVAAIRLTIDTLRDRGVERVVTSALTPAEERAFTDAGFRERERLHLLRHDLEQLPRVDETRLRRSRRTDRAGVLETDAEAFESFWRLDDVGLTEAIKATPTARVRVAGDSHVVGYSVSGRAGTAGYVQRLAVRPTAQGTGLGKALVTDGLRWMRRRGATHALVNTQMANERALQLYLAVGFRPEPHDLAVLEADLLDKA